MCNPPEYERNSKEVVDLFQKERDDVSNMLKTKARMVVDVLNSCKRLKCQEIQGAMYAFPRLFLTASAIEAAKTKGMEPCEYFCRRMLEQTGIITVPGMGMLVMIILLAFGQREGTYHFRLSLLIWELKEFSIVMETMKSFTEAFFVEYP